MDLYDPSQVLFRYAKELALRARERHAEYRQSGDIERRNREADACLGAVIMAHSALESWINQVRERAGADVRRQGEAWHERWTAYLPAIAEAKGRTPATSAMPANAAEALADLNALRNFPVHADARARDRLETRFPGVASFPELLLAESVIPLLLNVDQACRYAEQVIGESAPQLEGAWPGWPEA